MLIQVNMQPHRLAVLIRTFTSNGPKKSTPVWKNGGDEAVTQHGGKSAIIVGVGFRRDILQRRHWRIIDLVCDLQPTIHRL